MQICVFLFTAPEFEFQVILRSVFTAPEFEFQVILRSVFLNFHFCLLTACISEGLKMEDAVSLVDLSWLGSHHWPCVCMIEHQHYNMLQAFIPRCTPSPGLIYRGQDVSAFYPKPDVILLADVVYYEEVSAETGILN